MLGSMMATAQHGYKGTCPLSFDVCDLRCFPGLQSSLLVLPRPNVGKKEKKSGCPAKSLYQ